LVSLLAAVSLAGCALFGIATPDLYNHVDALAKKLDLSSVGTVQYEGHYGLGWQADTPTFIAIVSGPDASDRISEELAELGLTKTGSSVESRTLWSKGDGGSYYLVVVREVKPGDEVLVGKQLVRVEESGIAISVQ
jgi:hypothetical protein